MPDGRIRSTRRLLVAGLTLIIAGTLVASAFIALRLRQEAISAANATVAMHSRAFEDHLTLALQAVDITVKGIALGPAARTDAAGNNALFDILRNAPHLRYVVDRPPGSPELLARIERDVLTLNHALGYEFNTV